MDRVRLMPQPRTTSSQSTTFPELRPAHCTRPRLKPTVGAGLTIANYAALIMDFVDGPCSLALGTREGAGGPFCGLRLVLLSSSLRALPLLMLAQIIHTLRIQSGTKPLRMGSVGKKQG